MGRLISITDTVELKKGALGSIKRKSGSKNLYVDFHYFGRRIEKSSGMADTPKNSAIVREWLDRQVERIAKGTFVFADAFPNASEEEKRFFATLEGRVYSPEPKDVLFGDYVSHWRGSILPTYSIGKQGDDVSAIDYWLLPYWGHFSFYDVTAVALQRFISQLKWRYGKNKGKPLSSSRIKNVMIPLRAIWNDACDENHWNLPDPFARIGKHIPKRASVPREVLRFDEWSCILSNLAPFYRSTMESMIMTGMIASEVAGFRKTDIKGGYMYIRNSIVKGNEKEELKTPYRKRRMPITKALRPLLDDAMSKSDGKYVFTMEDGGTYDIVSFGKDYGPWAKAFKAAGVPYRTTYILRHTYVAWALTIGINTLKLESLMGHNSKSMIYDVYGKYVEGLEKDRDKILNYFGEDFLG